MSLTARIRVRSHHFVVDKYGVTFRKVLREFAGRVTLYELKRDPEHGFMYRAAVQTFAARTQSNSQQRFHINMYNDFIQHLKDNAINLDHVEIVHEKPTWKSREPGWSVNPDFKPYETQLDPLEHFVKEEGPPTRLVELQTGGGKSVVFVHAVARLNMTPMLFVKSAYIDKWVIDFKKSTDIDHGRIHTVRGMEELQEIMQRAMHDPSFNPGVIIISVTTYQNFLKLYEEHEEELLEMGFACTPENFFQTMRCGIHGLDEGHEFFHLNFKIGLYINTHRSLVMTATLLSRDEMMMRLYELAYPPATRVAAGAYKQYIEAYSVAYGVVAPERLKTTEFRQSTYSHTALEKCITRNPKYKAGYFKMVLECLNRYYWTDWQEGNKVAVYCATKLMCTELTEWLKDRLPNRTIARYIEGDPYSNLMEPEIRVTTPGKAGTAVDIPGLKMVLMTISMDSIQRNLQILGRLREMKKTGQTPRFVWVYCADVRKHVDYNKRRCELFHGKTLRTIKTTYGPPIF